MINLIPPEGHRMVRREYLSRVGAIFGFLTTGALVAATFLLLPTYMLLSHQLNAGAELAASSEEASGYAEATGALRDASRLAKRLSASTGSINASEVLQHVNATLSSDIALTALLMDRNGATTTIAVRGKARTRESLRQYVDALKRDAFFLDARVPVSDLARDTDLVFSLSLSLRVPGS